MTFPKRDSGFSAEPPETIVRDMSPEDYTRLKNIGRNYLERYMSQCWIENDDQGFTGWRWDKYNVLLMIVSAANRYGDIIVMGPRHYSNMMVTQIEAYGGIQLLKEYAGEEGYEQGFVDQYSTFHTREEALAIAEAAGQIRYPENVHAGQLFSEALV